MTLTFGYEIESTNGSCSRLIAPPMLSKKITLTTGTNTNRWVFYGTRKEILTWLRNHPDLILENGLFDNTKPRSFYIPTELVIDVQSCDDEPSYYNYYKSFIVSDYTTERIKVEIRPRIESKDRMIDCVCRTIVADGCRLGDWVDDLDKVWHQPARSYYRLAMDVLMDAPPPTHVLSADPPVSVHHQ